MPLISAIDESISLVGNEKVISYGLVLGDLSNLLISYDILRKRYFIYYKRTFGKEYPYKELKFSNLLRDSVKNGIELNYVIKSFVFPSLYELRDYCICRSILFKKRMEDKVIEIAGLSHLRGYKIRSLLTSSVLNILLYDTRKCEIMYDKGLLLKPREIEIILARLNKKFKMIQKDSISEPIIQIADFIAGVSKLIKLRNAYLNRNLFFIFID